MAVRQKELSYEVIVVGGGLSGLCAAIAAARNGAKTAVIQNRSMFGGPASSEVRMHVVGANCHATKPDLRETGILEEILLENKRRNPYSVFSVFDMILWEKAFQQEGLDAYLNTNAEDVILDGDRICGIVCHQNTTETEFTFYGQIFIDATGHGTLGVMAGAASRTGSEGREEFNEPTAPLEPNTDTMGNSLMFVAVNRGEPVEFICPDWAYHFTEEDLRFRPHVNQVMAHQDGDELIAAKDGKDKLPEFSSVDAGYWWIELGGDYDDIIGESEEIRDELMKCVWGVWDHLKNGADHGLANYDLEWVGIVPGYRESRRLEGDYLLTENDVRSNKRFDDAVAYGGWPMDIHTPGGVLDFDQKPSRVFNFEGCYTIPYRCYYSRNVSNLMMAGRDISVSKMAFSSTRVMGTCSVGGQASGTAAAMAVRYGCTPRQIGQEHMEELQQTLLRQDCYIPGVVNQDREDLARHATVSADSETPGCPAQAVINGISRGEPGQRNCWESEPLSETGARLTLKLGVISNLSQVQLTFDTDLSHEIMPSIVRAVRERQVKGLPHELVRDYNVTLRNGGETIATTAVHDNGQRVNVLNFDKVACDEIEICVQRTWGLDRARVFEVRAYG